MKAIFKNSLIIGKRDIKLFVRKEHRYYNIYFESNSLRKFCMENIN